MNEMSVAGARTAAPPMSVGEAAGVHPVPAPVAPRRRRQNAAVLAAATVLGLWLGLAAPSVSPVAPGGTKPSVVSVAEAPVVPVVPVDPAGRAGGGDRADPAADQGRQAGQSVRGGVDGRGR